MDTVANSHEVNIGNLERGDLGVGLTRVEKMMDWDWGLSEMAVNSCLEYLEGRMTLKGMLMLVPPVGKRGTNEWRRAVILDFGSFTRRGLLADRVHPAKTLGREWGQSRERSRGFTCRSNSLIVHFGSNELFVVMLRIRRTLASMERTAVDNVGFGKYF